jgi:hypothetical protein
MNQDIKKKIGAAFAANKKHQELWATSNGHCFTKEHDARQAAKELEDKKPVLVKRDDFKDEIVKLTEKEEEKPTGKNKRPSKNKKQEEEKSGEENEGGEQP